jgi:hypothetical protein
MLVYHTKMSEKIFVNFQYTYFLNMFFAILRELLAVMFIYCGQKCILLTEVIFSVNKHFSCILLSIDHFKKSFKQLYIVFG